MVFTGVFGLLVLPANKIDFSETCGIKINLKAHGEKSVYSYNSVSVIKNKLKRNNTFVVVNVLIS